VNHEELHEAWRYGAGIHEDDEKRALVALRELDEWCRKKHRR
jgi:hypothetical protein